MAARKTKKPTRKYLERFRFNISTKNNGRNGYLVKTVRKLVKHMSRRLRQLTSKQRQRHLAVRKLMIVIKYQAKVPMTLGKFSHPRRLKTYQKKIPLRTERRHRHYQLNFWHELNTKAIQWRVMSACCQIKREYFRRAKYIGIKALKFVPLHLPRWITDTDPKEIEDAMKRMDAQCQMSSEIPYIPYMPEFERVLRDDVDYVQSNKIPLIKSRLTVKGPEIKKASGVIIQKRSRNEPNLDYKKMRQTTIDEYFKPRGTNCTKSVRK